MFKLIQEILDFHFCHLELKGQFWAGDIRVRNSGKINREILLVSPINASKQRADIPYARTERWDMPLPDPEESRAQEPAKTARELDGKQPRLVV